MSFRKIKILIIAALGAFMVFATINVHIRLPNYSYLGEFWADKSGYNVYLPALFVYKLDVTKMPDSIEQKTGLGFSLDKKNNKFVTKYPCGVAIMQAPFFIVTHYACKIFDPKRADGWSRPYHYVTDFSAIFYFLIGFFFLSEFLKKYMEDKTALIALFVMFLGTNLYYYSVREGGFSHVYSFALFSVWLYLWKDIIDRNLYRSRKMILLAVVTGFIILTRQIDTLLLPFFFMLDVTNLREAFERFKKIGLKYLAFSAGIIILIFIPQMIYNVYLTGHLLQYSYGNEGFSNILKPDFAPVLFSFQNGLFAMNPIWIIALFGITYLILNKQLNGWIIILLIITTSYIYASWWIPNLGCGYGNRGFVDIYPLMALPFALSFKRIFSIKNEYAITIVTIIIVALIIINLKLCYAYDDCWWGKDQWDYKEYFKLLSK